MSNIGLVGGFNEDLLNRVTDADLENGIVDNDEDDFAEDEDCEGFSHYNDDGEGCDCDAQECGPNGSCPECGAKYRGNNISLVCGDHGCKCNKCGATFTCP